MSFDIKLIQKDKILDLWPKISHHAENLERRSHGRYNTADILHQMIELPYFVWIVWEEENPIGFFICGVNVYPRKKYLDLNRIELDKRLLKNFYLNKGYYNVEIESSSAVFSDNYFELIYFQFQGMFL